MNWRRCLVSAGLVILTNAFVLIGVAYNRASEPEAEITLTERELPLAYGAFQTDENTELALRLHWQHPAHRFGPWVMFSHGLNSTGSIKPSSKPLGMTARFLCLIPLLNSIMTRCCLAKPLWSWHTVVKRGHAGSKRGTGIKYSWLNKSTRGNGRNRTWSNSTMRTISCRKPDHVS